MRSSRFVHKVIPKRWGRHSWRYDLALLEYFLLTYPFRFTMNRIGYRVPPPILTSTAVALYSYGNVRLAH
jgi:hypothetical protein